jgi:hypothetical protein
MAPYKSDYYKKYFEINKEKLQEKIKCDLCGVEYMRCNKAHHEKSKKHKNIEMGEKIKKMERGDIVETDEEIEKKELIKIINDIKIKIDNLEKRIKK